MPKEIKNCLYNQVYKILKTSEEARNSDRKLIWDVLYSLGLCTSNFITIEDYMKAPSSESITRAGRRVKQSHPELKGNKRVEEMRKKKEATKGNFIFQDLFKWK